MGNEGWMHDGMAGWSDGGWHWMLGFHGILSLLFLTVIVVVGIVLVRDWRRDRSGGLASSGFKTSHVSGAVGPGEHLEKRSNR